MKINIKKITISALLIALQIMLSRFLSFQAFNMKIGFSFVPIVISAYLLGMGYTIFVASISDVLGALIFPSGTFFIGFTLTAVLTAVIYSTFIYCEKCTLLRVIFAVVTNQIICSILLNTLWISILYHTSFTGILSTRLMQSLIMIPVQFVVTSAICYKSFSYIKNLKLKIGE